MRAKKPAWLKVIAPGGASYTRIKSTLGQLKLHTVCEEAHCPNVGECWREGTATVMVLGEVCTRGCRFCAVTSGNPRGVVDVEEPAHVARAVTELGLRYVVLTMVNRDDLPDGGAGHVAETVRRLRAAESELLIEALVGDFQGDPRAIDTVLAAGPDVFAHNVEVVKRISRRVRDGRCDYEGSLRVLRYAGDHRREGMLTKSSLMVGAGERDEEVGDALVELRQVGVDVVTIGQYLRPSAKHLPVDRYVEPARFEAYREQGERLGFRFVASGPLVRSSYRAAEAFVRAAREEPGVPAPGP